MTAAEDSYACKCLNIRIRAAAPNGSSPPHNDPDFKPLYVGDEGIAAAHSQVTLRTRSKCISPESSTRHVSVTCLICQTLVYRVLQDDPAGIATVEGPVLPTEDWAERDILKSKSGWIEVHSGCLSGSKLLEAEKSPSYSAMFSVILPQTASPVLTSKMPSYTPPSSSPTPGSYRSEHLPPLPPFLPPPPFTPAHPVFVHFAVLASARSDAIRQDAEEFVAQIIRQKVKEITREEEILKRDVELLWRAFRRGSDAVYQPTSANAAPASKRRDSGAKPWSGAPETTESGKATPFAVREFTPSTNMSRGAASTSLPRMSSALSSSLAAASTMLLARPDARKQLPVTQSPSPLDSPLGSSPTWPATRALPMVSKSVPAESTNDPDMTGSAILRDAFRRNMDQALDMATSMRYTSVLEGEMMDTMRKRGRAGEAHAEAVAAREAALAGRSPPPPVTGQVERGRSRTRTPSRSRAQEQSGDRGRADTKGKRKVTFDVQPAVVTITRELEAEQREREAEKINRNAGEMIFELEEETDGVDEEHGPLGSGASLVEAKLPLLEPARAPRRPKTSRRTNSDTLGLPQSLSALRPSSLPAPVVFDRPIPGPSSLTQARLEPASFTPETAQKREHKRTASAPVNGAASPDPREEDIRRLVAADVPSHRGAWKRDGLAWQTFVRRRGGNASYPGPSIIAEEDETEEDETDRDRQDEDETEEDSSLEEREEWTPYKDSGLSRSLPIGIGPLPHVQQPEYEVKTSLADKPGILVPALRSSTAMRKASYAERDRRRSMDPGALDFAEEDEDEYDEDDDGAAGPGGQPGTYVGERGRQRALKILEARSKIPDSGMWRSLAS